MGGVLDWPLGGHTFMVDSVGLDDRSWIDRWGHPHSLNMRVQERYRRPTLNRLEMHTTITDPEIYSKPWVSNWAIHALQLKKGPDDRLKTFCVPSEEQAYVKDQLNPAEGFPQSVMSGTCPLRRTPGLVS